jgi:hypothetical protein
MSTNHMKIENPAIVAALERAAYVLNLSPSEVIETLLSSFVESMQETPSQYICEHSREFPHRTGPDAEVAAERIAELATSEALEGKTAFTIACEVIEGRAGFLVRVKQLHPRSGVWLDADGGELSAFGGDDGEDDGEDWWKQTL